MDETCTNCGQRLEANWAGCPDCGTPRARGRGEQSRRSAKTRTELAFLIVKIGEARGQSFPLAQTTNIGRDPKGNDIVLPDDPSLSRHHARVRYEDGCFVVHDLASKAGSWLGPADGERKKIAGPVRLAHGDVLQFGNTQLIFMLPEK
jgi:hypothetical protein